MLIVTIDNHSTALSAFIMKFEMPVYIFTLFNISLWLAYPCGRVLDLRLWGSGFESHPQFCAQMPTQHVVPLGLVNECQRKIGSKWAYHEMHWPHIHGLIVSAGVRLRANETRDNCRPMGPW